MSPVTLPPRSPDVDRADGRPAWQRVGRRGLIVDAAVAVALAGLVLGSGYLFRELAGEIGVDPPTALTFGAGLVMCLALVLRRVYPIAVFVVVSVAFSVYGFSGGHDALVSSVALFIATVAAGSHGAPVVRDWVRGVVIAGLFGTIIYVFYVAEAQDAPLAAVWFGQAYVFALNVFYFAAAWVLGDQLRIRRLREAQLAERTAELSARQIELEAERERSAEKAAVDERLRIARELHDALGHHVSVIGVQAAAQRRALDRDGGAVEATLRSIESSSRQAVTEVQRALRLLRDEQATRRSPGTLTRLGELADEVRRAGVTVTIQVDEQPDLPIEVELAVVRIVQESLTNVLRHAGPGSSAWVKVRIDDGRVRVEVSDDGRGEPLADDRDPEIDGRSRGTGLRGMRERVEVHGGGFRAGPQPGGGWTVEADVPFDVDAPAGASVGTGNGERISG